MVLHIIYIEWMIVLFIIYIKILLRFVAVVLIRPQMISLFLLLMISYSSSNCFNFMKPAQVRQYTRLARPKLLIGALAAMETILGRTPLQLVLWLRQTLKTRRMNWSGCKNFTGRTIQTFHLHRSDSATVLTTSLISVGDIRQIFQSCDWFEDASERSNGTSIKVWRIGDAITLGAYQYPGSNSTYTDFFRGHLQLPSWNLIWLSNSQTACKILPPIEFVSEVVLADHSKL